MNHDLPPWARAILRIRYAMYVLGALLILAMCTGQVSAPKDFKEPGQHD